MVSIQVTLPPARLSRSKGHRLVELARASWHEAVLRVAVAHRSSRHSWHEAGRGVASVPGAQPFLRKTVLRTTNRAWICVTPGRSPACSVSITRSLVRSSDYGVTQADRLDHGFVQSEKESFAEMMARALRINPGELKVCIAENRIGAALLERFREPKNTTDTN